MMNHRKTDQETYVDYYYDKMGMIPRLRFEGKEAVDLTDGITDVIVREQASSGIYKTPEDVLQYLSGRLPSASKSASRGKPSKGSCYHCHQSGHMWKDCPELLQSQKQSRDSQDNRDKRKRNYNNHSHERRSGRRYDSVWAADKIKLVGESVSDVESSSEEEDGGIGNSSSNGANL